MPLTSPARVQHDFQLTIDLTRPLFTAVAPVPLSQTLQQFLKDFSPLGLAMPTEKARSEVLVAPLLVEVWKRTEHQVGLFSGVEFNVDPAAGLAGVCDFLLSRSPQLLFVEAPVLAVVEAKKDSISDSLGQCAAEMVAVQRFNEQAKRPLETVHGCVTTGAIWRFLKLQRKALAIDLDEFHISQPERILGVLLHCVGAT
jgi:hypothetical protein